MNSLYSPSISIVIALMLPCGSSHSQELKPVTEANKGTPSLITPKKDAYKLAVIHYARQDISDEKIVTMFKNIAHSGDVRGTMWLARLYHKGRCSLPKRQDFAQKMAKNVIANIMEMADKGDTEAQFLLASAYHEGLAVDQDYKKAAKWYLQPSAAGHIIATNNLGSLLAHGYGIAPDITKARLLFARALKMGSRTAVVNSNRFRDDNRDDTKRLATLRITPLVQTLGMQIEDGIEFLVKSKLITDSKDYKEEETLGRTCYHFRADGIVLAYNKVGRITQIEGHAAGSRSSEQFRGSIPFGVNWNDSRKSARMKLGQPDDYGDVATDQAYGMAFRMENVFFAVMFNYNSDKNLKLWRVFEKWPAKYPAVKTPKNATPKGEPVK